MNQVPRITCKYLQKWVTDKLKELEIPMHCTEVVKTRFRGQDYENGATTLYIRLAENEKSEWAATMYANEFIHQIQERVNQGYKLQLYLQLGGGNYIEFEKSYLATSAIK